jgi:hypothetical protein
VTHFLVVYRRSTAELVECRDLGPDREGALLERFEREKKEKDDPDVEVVLLSATSREALEKTHARYFRNDIELRESLLNSSTSGSSRSQ